MVAWFYRNLLIPVYEKGIKRRKSFGYWRGLESSQWDSPDELRARQLTGLRQLLDHACATASTAASHWVTAWA